MLAEELRSVIAGMCTAFGIVLERASPRDPATLYRLAMPQWRLNLELDPNVLAYPRAGLADLAGREVHRAQRELFRAAIDHIAKHDREPLDRLRHIEQAARALLDMLGPNHGQWTLENLLRSKPGAVSWDRNGYGPDPEDEVTR